MNRLSCLAVAVVAAAVILVSGASFAADAPQKGGQGGARVFPSSVTYPAVPGYYMLRTPGVQKELELDAGQKKKLEEIGEKYHKQMRSGSQDWSKIREMSAEERKKAYAEIRRKRTEQMERAREEVEKVLLPNQVELLKQIGLRMRGARMLHNPRVLKQLKATDEQKEKFAQIRKEMQEKMQQLQKESFEQTMKILTPEQRKQLEELASKGDGGMGTIRVQGGQ